MHLYAGPAGKQAHGAGPTASGFGTERVSVTSISPLYALGPVLVTVTKKEHFQSAPVSSQTFGFADFSILRLVVSPWGGLQFGSGIFAESKSMSSPGLASP